MSTLRSYRPLSRMSEKARARQDARAACIRAVMKRERYKCQVKVRCVCTRQATDVHEYVTRAHCGSITDPTNCFATCRACHRHLHEHPEYAYENGFVKSKKWEARNGL